MSERFESVAESEVLVYSELGVDVSQWELVGIEALGTKPKRWVRNPTDDSLWLFKEATYNPDPAGSKYRKGDDWAEVVAALLATELGIACAQLRFAYETTSTDQVLLGVIGRSFLRPNESLVHGNELLAERGTIVTKPGRIGYTLEAVEGCLSNAMPYVGLPVEFTGWDAFIGYLVLDALIGNTDRHEENWAVIVDDETRLAPSFDHSSSLGFALSDSERLERLSTRDDYRTPAAFASRAASKFEGQPHPIDVAVKALESAGTDVRAYWATMLDVVQDFRPVIEAIPEARMSGPSRAFAHELFNTNIETLRDRLSP